MIATTAAGTTLDTSEILEPGTFALDLANVDRLVGQIERMLERFLPQGPEAVTRDERS